MLVYIQSADTTSRPVHPAQQKAITERIERLLKENEYQKVLTVRRIAAATKKQQAQDRLMLLTEFLASRESGRGSVSGLPNALVRKATLVEAGVKDTVAELQHKLELLELEKLLLQSQLRNASKDSGIIRN
ncbi:hypothetical protein [Flavobacterium sp.]|uniref:hypothetical protein n=1 Tax=Flavobacterium sp. TaxID=239 RepID=UPI00260E0502|nr:hypothetical protein [Flavobacterium sp.]